jgi:hypothetical protein
MLGFYKKTGFLFVFFILVILTVHAQVEINYKKLLQLKNALEANDKLLAIKLDSLAKKYNWKKVIYGQQGATAYLTGVTETGLPEYTSTESNLLAANTTGASQLWNNTAQGISVTGSSEFLRNRLAIWDGGPVLQTHSELSGRVVLIDDNTSKPVSERSHATHVTGTMIAVGNNVLAKGMAFEAPNIHSFDFDNDVTEMAGNPNYLLSNHSYGSIAGWSRNSSNVWQFYGAPNATEDYKFGYYDSRARYIDSLCVLNPYYLPVKSAGNNRSQNGPAVGENYNVYNSSGQFVSAPNTYTEGSISRNDTFDIISTYGNAKNMLTVGAVSLINNGYLVPADVRISNFSSYGPTDDGRIKPDVVAAGVSVTSSTAESNNAYSTYNGTSMSTPNATGSLLLVQELYKKETDNFLLAATLKGLAIHTTNEAGPNPGPDYKYGWGLLDVLKAAKVIKGRATAHSIQENTLNQGQTFTQNVIASGNGPLVATISWTDYSGVVFGSSQWLNNRTPQLVNDLDIRVISASGTELPWRLDPARPNNAATKGDNILDNVEKIEILNPIVGQQYEIRVTHKGNLRNNQQAFSLILSGIGGTAYCASAPGSNANSKITNVTFGGINKNGGTGCTTYNNFTDNQATIGIGETLPFSVSLGTCGTNADKIAKIFIDWNGNGLFTDANELVATSNVINGAEAFTGSITAPAGIVAGNFSRMRVVVAEQNVANNVTSCGTYNAGETQDYSITFIKASVDAELLEIITPGNTACANDSALIAVKIKNNGSGNISNTPVSLVIRDASSNIVATLNGQINSTIAPNNTGTVYFQDYVNLSAAGSYSYTAYAAINNEQNRVNDTLRMVKTTSIGTTQITSANGQLCAANEVNLNAVKSGADLDKVYWFTTANGGTPFASGTNVISNNITANRMYYAGINDAKLNIGFKNKAAALAVTGAGGGYNQFSPGVDITVNAAPLIIERARMYFGNSGGIIVTVVDTVTQSTVARVTLDVNATRTTPGAGVQTDDPNDMGVLVPLNLVIPSVGAYRINITYLNGATTYRNNTTVTDATFTYGYPFGSAPLLTITGNNATGNRNAFYYYFYDMVVKPLGCRNNNARVPVTAGALLTPTISLNGGDITCSEATGTYQWYLNGGALTGSGANAQTYTPTASGNYTVIVTKGGCFFTSNTLAVTVTSITNVNPSEISMVLSPNPTASTAQLRFKALQRAHASITIIDAKGTTVYTNQFNVLANENINKAINVSTLANGVYTVRIQLDKKQYVKKLVIAK